MLRLSVHDNFWRTTSNACRSVNERTYFFLLCDNEHQQHSVKNAAESKFSLFSLFS